jgi:serine/threonine protein kinase
VGAATDIYALGCVLYECLTGQLTFRRDDDAALLWAHLVEMPPQVTAIRPEVPAGVDAVVLRAMAKEPADRYESAEELLVDLEQALGVPPTESPTTGPPLAARRQSTVVSEAAPAGAAATTTPVIQAAGRNVAAPAGEEPSVLLPTPRTGEPASGASPPQRRDTTPTPTRSPPPGGLPPEEPRPVAGTEQPRKWWIALVAGLVVLALTGAGVMVYRSLNPSAAAHATAASTHGTTSATPSTRGTPSPTLSPPHRVAVPGTVSWTDTGVSLTARERFVVHASGKVSFIQGATPVGPDGDSQPHAGVCVLPGPDHHAGLIGRISVSGVPFLVGSNFAGSADRSGELFLGINDIGVGNNGGAFTATVQVIQP